ncbi:MAG: type III toxin-antitoxin system ToxN/AbiQ family toxin [Lachnospiraceae bacterium]|nr:type III toxin-antitoxin system ToxN/AbiQ family toxin [Lachnospiraceae bacterium]
MSFSFYTVDAGYCDYLRKRDPCVPYTMDQKAIRPFVGIVFSVNSFYYYAPLTSPKPKHLHMKSQIDFLKIKNGEWGAINLNNMIPVHPSCLKKVEMKILETDPRPDAAYKNLLANQLSWCNSHREIILKQAQKLYQMIVGKRAWGNLVSRCCDFALDEQQCAAYCRERSSNIEVHEDNGADIKAEMRVFPSM